MIGLRLVRNEKEISDERRFDNKDRSEKRKQNEKQFTQIETFFEHEERENHDRDDFETENNGPSGQRDELEARETTETGEGICHCDQ